MKQWLHSDDRPWFIALKNNKPGREPGLFDIQPSICPFQRRPFIEDKPPETGSLPNKVDVVKYV
jgi:hypothetical protein